MRRGLPSARRRIDLAATLLSGSPAGAARPPPRRPAAGPPGRRRPWCWTAPGCGRPSIRLHDGDRQLTATLGRLDRAGRQLAGPGPVVGHGQAADPARRRQARLPQPGPVLVAHPGRGPPTTPGAARTSRRTACATPTWTPSPTTTGAGRCSTPSTRSALAWYYTGRAAYAEHAVADPAHLVPGPGHQDEPQPRPRPDHPLQERRPGDRHHRLLPAVHRRPRRHRHPRHRRPRLDAAPTTPACGAGTPTSTSWLGGSLRQGRGRRRQQPRHVLRHAARRAPTGHRPPGPGPADRARRARQADRPADRRRRQPAAGTGPHPQLPLLDLRPGRPHPARRTSAGTSAWTCGRTAIRRARASCRRWTSCCPRPPASAAWAYPELEFQRFAASDVVRAAADAGDAGGEGRRAGCWRRRPAATCGRCGRPRSSWTP